MVLSAFPSFCTGFEGCEKRLEIDFCGASLLAIKRQNQNHILSTAQCSILSVMSHKESDYEKNINTIDLNSSAADAYLLSESSLFVFEHKVIIKTCGTTSLLFCLTHLLTAASQIGAFPQFLQFSRSNFMFPDQQPYPHKNFDSEVKFLNNTLFKEDKCGSGFIFGPLQGPRWHLYIADADVSSTCSKDQTLEILMFNLDPNCMKRFYRRVGDEDKVESEIEYNGRRVTLESGIADLIEGARIDSHLFSPCGYSCNGLVDSKSYFMIHITPEPECSFVSFETNIRIKSYNRLLRDVLRLFRPATFCVSLFVDEASVASDSETSLDQNLDGFLTCDRTFHKFEGHYNVCVANFAAIIKPERPVFGIKAYKPSVNETQIVNESSNEILSPSNIKINVGSEFSFFNKSLDRNGFEILGKNFSNKLIYSKTKDLNYEDLFNFVLPDLTKKCQIEIIEANNNLLNNNNKFENSSNFQNQTDFCLGKHISDLIHIKNADEAFFVVDLGQVFENFCLWTNRWPDIQLFYSIGCNSDPIIILTLRALGFGFSGTSMEQIDMLLALGIDSASILFSTPQPAISQLKLARARKIGALSFDNRNELIKISKHYADVPNLYLVLAAQCSCCCICSKCENGNLDTQKYCFETNSNVQAFGARLDDFMDLIRLANDLKLCVNNLSLSFPNSCVNSSFLSVQDYEFQDKHSLCTTQLDQLFNLICKIRTELDNPNCLRNLNFGSYCSKTDFDKFQRMAGLKNKTKGFCKRCDNFYQNELVNSNGICDHRSTYGGSISPTNICSPYTNQSYTSDMQIFETICAEPSRFFVESAYTMVVSIVSKRQESIRSVYVENNGESFMKKRLHYFVDEGIYNSFSFIERSLHNGKACAKLSQNLEDGVVKEDENFETRFKPYIVPRHSKEKSECETSFFDSEKSNVISPTSNLLSTSSNKNHLFSCSCHDYKNTTNGQKIYQSTIQGRTCDSLDCIVDNVMLPELEIQKDWLYFKNMGANMSVHATAFNGFVDLPQSHYFIRRQSQPISKMNRRKSDSAAVS